MFRIFSKIFIGLLTFSASLATKFMSINNEQCKTRPTFIDLITVVHQFMISVDKCNGNCIAISEIGGRICVPNKAKNVNLNAFNLIIKINR